MIWLGWEVLRNKNAHRNIGTSIEKGPWDRFFTRFTLCNGIIHLYCYNIWGFWGYVYGYPLRSNISEFFWYENFFSSLTSVRRWSLENHVVHFSFYVVQISIWYFQQLIWLEYHYKYISYQIRNSTLIQMELFDVSEN